MKTLEQLCMEDANIDVRYRIALASQYGVGTDQYELRVCPECQGEIQDPFCYRCENERVVEWVPAWPGSEGRP